MISASSRQFFLRFFRAYPARSSLMVVLLALAGVAEGVGVVTLVPLLEVADSSGEPPSRIGAFVIEGLAAVGLVATIGVLLVVIVIAMTVKAALIWTAYGQVGYTVARVTRDLRVRLIQAVLRARWSHFADRTAGRLANAVSSEAVRAAWAYREACSSIADLFMILAYVTISARISLQITAFAIASGALLVVVLRRFVGMSRRAGNAQTHLIRSLSSRLVDVMRGIKPIKAMGREDLVLPLLERETKALDGAQRQEVLAQQGLKLFQEPALTVLLAAALYLLLGVQGRPLESVLVLAFVFHRLLIKSNSLQSRFQSVTVGESAYFSIMEEIEGAEALREGQSGATVDGVREQIRFENVTFGYDPSHPVLRGLDLTIPAGSFVGIHGESGSGKTTLADLVLGLHRPHEGEITIDGRPLAEISLREWRSHIGYVPQELLLFNDTILRNVTLGDESLTRDDVERALRLAEAWDFIAEREAGVDTLVGEAGARLSGGQRQRIAIARALVTRPSLLILDEVTTALDPDTEREICETFRHLRGEVTILSISHQPAMREAAEVAWVLKDGRLVSAVDAAAVRG